MLKSVRFHLFTKTALVSQILVIGGKYHTLARPNLYTSTMSGKKQATLARFFTVVNKNKNNDSVSEDKKDSTSFAEKTASLERDVIDTKAKISEPSPELENGVKSPSLSSSSIFSSTSSPSMASSVVERLNAKRGQGTTPDEVETESQLAPPAKKRVTESSKAETTADSSTTTNANTFPNGSKIYFSELCSLFNEIEQISSRLAITEKLTNYFNSVLQREPTQLTTITYLCINRLGPDYIPNLELGLGEGMLVKAISESCGKTSAAIRKSLKELGDLGIVASKARAVQPTMFKPKPMTALEIYQTLLKIATTTGTNSQNKKIGLIKKMLTTCNGSEAKFLIRSLESKLRIGVSEKTVLIALAQSLNKLDGKKISTEEAENMIKDVFCQVPNYEIVINECLEKGMSQLLENVKLTPGIPLKPMLAKPTKSIGEVLDRFQGSMFTCEYKYDGERAQIHVLENGTFNVFSRNSENMTERYPEIQMSKYLKPNVKSLILDCEVVAYDLEQMKILPFQVLSTRKRKDVALKDIKVRVCLFVFDCLLFNGDPLINKSLDERRQIIKDSLAETPGELQYANQITTTEIEELQKYLDQSIHDCCEGLMVKVLEGSESHYEPSKRSRNWLKVKKDYLAGVGDSLDLVVLGAYHGKGKRTGTYGGFLLGSYNDDSGEFETCCKIGTGFSDELLAELFKKLEPTEISHPKSSFVYDSSAAPDVWFEPSMVFEVLCADLSMSPIYKAGESVLGKGISLRFPRFVRLRDDKDPENATSSNQVIDFYQSQKNI